jgi:hypothetical protein
VDVRHIAERGRYMRVANCTKSWREVRMIRSVPSSSKSTDELRNIIARAATRPPERPLTMTHGDKSL